MATRHVIARHRPHQQQQPSDTEKDEHSSRSPISNSDKSDLKSCSSLTSLRKGGSAPTVKKSDIDDVLEIRRALDIAEKQAKAVANPCVCCNVSREKGAKIWSAVNEVLAMLAIYYSIYNMVQVHQNFKFETDFEYLGCKVQVTPGVVAFWAFNLIFTLINCGASSFFTAAVYCLKHKETLFFYSDIYKYNCLICISAWGYFFIFFKDVAECISNWNFWYYFIVAILIGTSIFGYYICLSYQSWLKNPEIHTDQAQELTQPRPRPTFNFNIPTIRIEGEVETTRSHKKAGPKKHSTVSPDVQRKTSMYSNSLAASILGLSGAIKANKSMGAPASATSKDKPKKKKTVNPDTLDHFGT